MPSIIAMLFKIACSRISCVYSLSLKFMVSNASSSSSFFLFRYIWKKALLCLDGQPAEMVSVSSHLVQNEKRVSYYRAINNYSLVSIIYFAKCRPSSEIVGNKWSVTLGPLRLSEWRWKRYCSFLLSKMYLALSSHFDNM